MVLVACLVTSVKAHQWNISKLVNKIKKAKGISAPFCLLPIYLSVRLSNCLSFSLSVSLMTDSIMAQLGLAKASRQEVMSKYT